MSRICPTVTANDLHEYREQLERVESFAERVHIDLMDGKLAPTKSPALSEIWLSEKLICDIHLMYQNPSDFTEELIALKPNLVIIHAETHSSNDLPLMATQLREAGIKFGLALLPQTSVESIKYLLPHCQAALVFAGKLGYHGGEADLSQLNKIKELKDEHRWLEIHWDGGVNGKNAKQIVEAGVDVLNVGGFIQKSENPKDSYLQLVALLQS
jgi:ribulose-phosphate 3-epimerase